jgi:hypothetical protein
MKNPLSDLEHRARVALPDVAVEHLRMKAPERTDALDLRKGDQLINVLWTVADGICITEVSDDSVLDDEPSYVVHSVDDALQIVVFLLGAGMATDLHGVDDPAREAA